MPSFDDPSRLKQKKLRGIIGRFRNVLQALYLYHSPWQDYIESLLAFQAISLKNQQENIPMISLPISERIVYNLYMVLCYKNLLHEKKMYDLLLTGLPIRLLSTKWFKTTAIRR